MHTSTTSTGQLDPWQGIDLLQATQGAWFAQAPEHEILRIITDSRQAAQGDAFLALRGERFDAHDFAQQVTAQGASCLIVERAFPELEIPQLIVKDTRLALGHLGAYRRQQCTALKVIALTGSSGKTTTKEMLGSIFARLGATLVTRGNLNNDLGVPMMLLELRQEHRFAVIELGASHQGEIDYTAELVQPDVAGIINIGTAHLGEFGGREGICRAKSEIYPHIKANGVAIVPAADDFLDQISIVAEPYSQLSFGENGQVYAENIQLLTRSSVFDLVTPQGTARIELPFAGVHNVHNAEAAASFALALSISIEDIAAGLNSAQGAKGRLNFIQHKQHLFIDDTYNANPTSMRAAADVLSQQQGIKVMVVGDIGELGSTAAQQHYLLGRDLVSQAIHFVVAVGEFAPVLQEGARSTQYGKKLQAFLTQEQALPLLLQLVQMHQPQSMSFLFKGSRYTHMETLMVDLMEKL